VSQVYEYARACVHVRACGYIYVAYTRCIANGTLGERGGIRDAVGVIDALSAFLSRSPRAISLSPADYGKLPAMCPPKRMRRSSAKLAADRRNRSSRSLRMLFDRCIDTLRGCMCVWITLLDVARHQHGPLSRFDADCACYFKSLTRDSQRNRRRAPRQLISNAADLLFGAVDELILVTPLEALLNTPVLPEGLDDLVKFLKTERSVRALLPLRSAHRDSQL